MVFVGKWGEIIALLETQSALSVYLCGFVSFIMIIWKSED
jgi:hypothetical protein